MPVSGRFRKGNNDAKLMVRAYLLRTTSLCDLELSWSGCVDRTAWFFPCGTVSCSFCFPRRNEEYKLRILLLKVQRGLQHPGRPSISFVRADILRPLTSLDYLPLNKGYRSSIRPLQYASCPVHSIYLNCNNPGIQFRVIRTWFKLCPTKMCMTLHKRWR